MDLLVDGCVVVETEAGEAVRPLRKAEFLGYLKLGGWKLGLRINFNVPVFKKGRCRRIL
jgi:GxxExxY protein